MIFSLFTHTPRRPELGLIGKPVSALLEIDFFDWFGFREVARAMVPSTEKDIATIIFRPESEAFCTNVDLSVSLRCGLIDRLDLSLAAPIFETPNRRFALDCLKSFLLAVAPREGGDALLPGLAALLEAMMRSDSLPSGPRTGLDIDDGALHAMRIISGVSGQCHFHLPGLCIDMRTGADSARPGGSLTTLSVRHCAGTVDHASHPRQ